MAVKKLISSSSSSSSSSSGSSFERSVAQRTPSLKCKQHDSEGEEKESEDSSSEDDNDSSSDEERLVAQPAPSLKRKQQHSKEGEEKESEEDDEKTKSPATKSVSHPSQAHQSCTEQDKIKESVPHPSQQSSEEEEEEDEEDEEDDDEKAKSPATKSVSHPSQAHQSYTEQDKIKESVPHPSQQSSDQEEEEEDANESLVQSEKKLKPNFVPAKKQISSPSASSSCDDAKDSSSDKEQFVAQPVPSLKRKQRNSKEREEKESEGDSSDEEEDEEKAKSPVRKCVSHLSQAQQSCTEEEKQKENTKESVPQLSQQSSSSEEEEEEEEEEEDAKLPVENSESLVQPQKKKLKPNSVPAGKSPSTATNSAVQRLWSVEDELVLLHALSDHHNTYGKVPSSKEYGSFLSTIIGSLTFLATEKQLGNKIRTWKTNYAQRKKMGSKPKPLNPHEIEVFKICAKLFEDVRNTKSVGGEAKGNSSIYLREVISRQKLPTWLSTVEDMVQQLGESRARDLEAKAKQLSIDEMKLNAREVKLMADLFDFIADGMAGDG